MSWAWTITGKPGPDSELTYVTGHGACEQLWGIAGDEARPGTRDFGEIE